MFNYNKDSIIYVVCPAFNKTGGTELAHQLVYELNNQGAKAYITYYDNHYENPLNDAFLKYVKEYKLLDNVIDNSNNIIIFPEIKQDTLKKYKNIQLAVWWMSVDNFVKRNGLINATKHFGFLKALKNILKGNISLIKKPINKNIVHFYQSEYANQLLLKNKVSKRYRLSDYINEEYLKESNNIKKENNVLYNPKKGIEYTNKLINLSKDLNWIPIQNMTTEEVKELLSKSKVYIDFGNHPGKDRFPREAAISGCCVITSRNGSANYYEDVPIADEFKFLDKDENLNAIILKIKSCLENYDEENKKFIGYKEFIAKEHNIFCEDVAKIINKEG